MIDPRMITAWLQVACLAPSPHNNQPGWRGLRRMA